MSALYQSRALAEAAAEKLKAYAQPQRLMILSCLLGGERRVGEIEAATGIGQPALSQQLAELRRKALVRPRRQGTQIFYALADDETRNCVRNMEEMLGDSLP
jgi:DNA-binding transcriptional ArsR family regulator